MVSSTTSALDQFGNIVFEGNGQKFASIDQSSSATTAVVAAVTGMRIRILAACFNMSDGSTAPVLILKSASTQLSGEMTAQNDLQIVLPFNPAGWVQTESGEAFNVTSSGGGACNGFVVYDEVAAA